MMNPFQNKDVKILYAPQSNSCGDAFIGHGTD